MGRDAVNITTIVWGTILAIMALTAFILSIISIFCPPTPPIIPKYGLYWACMDGCSNMQELVFNYTADNQSMRDLHDQCTNRCSIQYTGAGWRS